MESASCQRGELFWVNGDYATPTQTVCSFQNFLQSSDAAESKLVKSDFLLGQKEQKPPNCYKKRRDFVNYFSKNMESLRALPEVESRNLF